MKKTSIVIVLLTIVWACNYGQQNELRVLHNESLIGSIDSNNQKFSCVEYTFPKRIYSFGFLPESYNMQIMLRSLSKDKEYYGFDGDVVIYDFNNSKTKWNKSYNYYNNSNMYSESGFVIGDMGRSFIYNSDNGELIKKIKNAFIYISEKNNIGIGFKYSSFEGSVTNKLQAVDLNNGKPLWTRELDCDFGVDNVFQTSDSTIIIVASGLHNVNIHTGKGYGIKLKTGIKDYSKTAGANAVGIAAGILTGTFVLSTGYDFVDGLQSGIIADSSGLYMASKNRIVKIDFNCYKLWDSSLPDDLTSKSSIFSDSNNIFLINHGYGNRGNRKIKMGKPYFACFDKLTGEEKYNNLLTVDDKAVVDSYLISDSTVYVLLNNSLSELSLNTGKLLAYNQFDEEKYGKVKTFLTSKAVNENSDSTYMITSYADSTNIRLVTNNDTYFSINRKLKEVGAVKPISDLWFYNLSYGDYKLITKGNKTLIIDSLNRRFGELEASRSAFVRDNKLYTKYDNKIKVIDLNILLNVENKVATSIDSAQDDYH